MSAMVISSAECFAGMAKPLEDYGITNIHFLQCEGEGGFGRHSNCICAVC